MSIFSKNKNDGGFIINTDADTDTEKISGTKNLAPHAITPEEVSSLWVTGDNEYQDFDSDKPSALDSLKKRMHIQSEENSVTEAKSKVDEAQPVIIESKEEIKKEDKEEVKENIKEDVENHEPVQDEKTLLEKLKRYTVDDQGHDLVNNKEPLYKLESVAEILESNSRKTLENLSKKYDISFDDLGKSKKTDTYSVAEEKEENAYAKKPTPITNSAATPTPAFEKMVSDAEKQEEKQLFENLFPSKKSTVIFDISIPDISDIDNHESGVTTENSVSDTATIRFTPIKDSHGNTDHISISSITKHIDLNSELTEEDVSQKSSSPQLEQSEFESFSPDCEMTDLASGKKLIRRLAVKKRSLFFSTFISALSVIAILVFLLPPISDFIISNPKTSMFICAAFLLVAIISNINMFADFKNIFKKRCSFDVLAALSSVLTLSLAICAALTLSNAYYIILLGAIILFVRSLCKFKEISAALGNLKQITGENSKNAVTLINDTATTFAMAKNTIEGDMLVAAHRNTNFVEDYMKHFTFSAKLSGKVSIMFLFTLILSAMSGIIAFFYYGNIFDAFYCAAAVSCVSAIPSIFLIDAFPLSAAAKKLNTKGAMIAGLYGAEKIEMANAAVVSTNDIFPDGTIKMYSMKVLSDNNIDQTILKAASLTAAVNSPLEAIFKNIAGTNNSYSIPDSDTVKYEKRLGISGWVDNELLFIGNRSLMEAHGIEIPSVEIDKKILRKGYFPVYVATATTACALIVIQYDVRQDIAKELRKINELGIMLLIDNCDPNINEEMLCDYFGLYEDLVKIMTNAGVHMYNNATIPLKKCSAPAAFRGSNLNFIKIINCASLIKKSNKLLTIMYAVFAVLGFIYFVYAAFSGLRAMPSQFTILMYELIATTLSIIGFLIRKP